MRKASLSSGRVRALELAVVLAFALDFINFFQLYFNVPYAENELFTNTIVSMGSVTRINIAIQYAKIAFLLLAAIIAIREKKVPVRLPMIVLVLSGVFWLVITLLEVGLRATLTANPTPLIFVMSLCIYIGYHDRGWECLVRCVFVASLAYTALAAYETMRFVNTYGLTVRLMTSGAVYALVAAIMLMYVNLLMNESVVQKHRLLTIMQITAMLLCALVLQSRSWLVHVLLLLVIFVYKLSSVYRYRKLVFTTIVVGICAVVAASWGFLLTISQSLLDRLNTDSRTEQLEAFFRQVSIGDLIVGGGLNASYRCFGKNYQFLDNLVLLTMFKYGAIPTLSYMVMLLSPLLYGITHPKSRAAKGTLFLLCWLAVMLGLGIYVSYSDTIYNYVIYLVVGRMMYLRDEDGESRRGVFLNSSGKTIHMQAKDI